MCCSVADYFYVTELCNRIIWIVVRKMFRNQSFTGSKSAINFNILAEIQFIKKPSCDSAFDAYYCTAIRRAARILVMISSQPKNWFL